MMLKKKVNCLTALEFIDPFQMPRQSEHCMTVTQFNTKLNIKTSFSSYFPFLSFIRTPIRPV